MNKVLRFLVLGILLLGLFSSTSAHPVKGQASFSCSNVTEIPPLECEALVTLYLSTNGGGWTNSTNWLVSNSPSTWFGVTVSGGHVTVLNLGWNNRLVGTLPPELGNLSMLEYLSIYSNDDLTGSIPPELGNLSLQWLYLDGNQLSGSIPSTLGNLSVLQYLYLNDNQLSGSIPSTLGNATNLNYLYLNDNQLSGSVPSTLSNLSYLRSLYLDDNQLSGNIPSELGDLENLQYLHLNNNQLSGAVPESLIDLTNLYVNTSDDLYGLDLDYNALTVPVGYPVAGNPLHEFLLAKDPNWHLRQTIEAVIGSDGGEMTSLDGTVNLVIPPNAVGDNTTFIFTPQLRPNFSLGKLTFANNSFLLTAVDGLGNPVTLFTQPVTVTINYDESSLNLSEVFLKLYYWHSATTTWLDAVTTCDPVGEYTRDLQADKFSLEICHLSEFAVVSDTMRIFLPTVLR